MSTIESPANFGKCQGVGIYKVTTLPAGLKFFLEVEERAIAVRIAEMGVEEVDAGPQEGSLCLVSIA